MKATELGLGGPNWTNDRSLAGSTTVASLTGLRRERGFGHVASIKRVRFRAWAFALNGRRQTGEPDEEPDQERCGFQRPGANF